ncbi:hypothetical protein [Martelella endophytica]|uniref:hypothetical protein n=1 Tax=Martelella endophytica TaxID=1486262 RepID=UPI000A40C074|nr:hypothetical protein [Martelella endophytica]
MSDIDRQVPKQALLTAADSRAEEAGYALWKERKVKKSVEASQDRKNLVPAKDVWKLFGFER